MFGIIKKMFIVLLTSLFNVSNHTKCLSLINRKFEIQPTFFNFHPNEYSQQLHYHPFAVKLHRCVASEACAPNKTGLNLIF